MIVNKHVLSCSRWVYALFRRQEVCCNKMLWRNGEWEFLSEQWGLPNRANDFYTLKGDFMAMLL